MFWFHEKPDFCWGWIFYWLVLQVKLFISHTSCTLSVEKAGLLFLFQMFASHSSYENPLLYCSYEEKEVGFRDSAAWGQYRVQGNIPILKDSGSERRKKVENRWEITVSVRFHRIKLHVISGKNYPLKHERPFLYCKVKEEVGDFRYTLTFIFWWKIEIPIWWLLFSYSKREDRLLFAESADYKEPFEILKSRNDLQLLLWK